MAEGPHLMFNQPFQLEGLHLANTIQLMYNKTLFPSCFLKQDSYALGTLLDTHTHCEQVMWPEPQDTGLSTNSLATALCDLDLFGVISH